MCSCLTSDCSALRCNGLAGLYTIPTPKREAGRWWVAGLLGGRRGSVQRIGGQVGFGLLLWIGGAVVMPGRVGSGGRRAICGGGHAGGEGVEARAPLWICIWVVLENFIWQKGPLAPRIKVSGRRMVCRESLQRVLVCCPLKQSRPLLKKTCDGTLAGDSPTPLGQQGSTPCRANSLQVPDGAGKRWDTNGGGTHDRQEPCCLKGGRWIRQELGHGC